jgi:hypothetical protein
LTGQVPHAPQRVFVRHYGQDNKGGTHHQRPDKARYSDKKPGKRLQRVRSLRTLTPVKRPEQHEGGCRKGHDNK